MKRKFRIILPLTLSLLIFPLSNLSQSANDLRKNARKSTTKQTASIKNEATSFDQDEISEAARLFSETADNILKLKVYQLAGTRKSDVAPQIAASVVVSGTEADRLAKIAGQVLRYHKLNELCSVVLFKSDNPTVFTYRLRSISLSTAIFDILTDDEATALISHEVGHLFFGQELELARTKNDAKLARIVELKCDAVALITLRNLKINPAVIVTALKKLIEAREKLALPVINDQSPSLAERINLTEMFLKQNKR